jgi:hypothetical protein
VFAPSPTKGIAVASRKHGNKSINGVLTAKKVNKYMDLQKKETVGK